MTEYKSVHVNLRDNSERKTPSEVNIKYADWGLPGSPLEISSENQVSNQPGQGGRSLVRNQMDTCPPIKFSF